MDQNNPKGGNAAEADRARLLTALLADAAPDDATDHEAVRKYVHRLAEAGLAVLFVWPGSKVPADMRSPQRRSADDKAARAAAKAAGRRGWDTVKSPAGLALATTDTDVLDGYLDRYVKTFADRYPEGVPVNLAVEVGGSGLVVVDCDTAVQMQRWRDIAAEDIVPGSSPTVISPGQLGPDGVTRVHSDGGHWWFTVPEGVQLPTGPGCGALTDGDDGFAVLWDRRYVLVPPSVREEGSYATAGEVRELPAWLAETITDHGQARAERAEHSRAVTSGSTVERWGASVTWAEILASTGWTPAGKVDGCGCETWTAPGPHASAKSATAHEPGCSRMDTPDPGLHIWTDHDIEPFGPVVSEHGNLVTRFRAVAVIHYSNDQGAAMEALKDAYGDLALDDADVEFLNGYGKAAPGGGTDDTEATTTAPAADEATERKIRDRASQLWIDREARKRLAAADIAEIELPPVTSLADLLDTDDDPVRFRIEGVWPSGGAKVLCAAPAGGGKTTLSGNLVRSLADGEAFLGAFEVTQRASRIVVIDNEMTQGMLKRWLRRQGVANLSAVVDVVNLRGQAGLFDLGNDRLRDRWARRLADLGCDFVVFDCLKPVLEAMGLDENREMGKLLYPLTEMLTTAGVDDVLVHHHMGHANERARGDSTLLGWSDANWKIVRDDDHPLQPRYFSTDKVRDADEPVREGLLSFDKATGRLTYVGGNRATTHQSENVEKRLTAVLDVLADNATEGRDEMNVSAIKKAVGGKKETTDEALALAEKRGLVTRRHQGRAKLYRMDPKACDPHYTGDDPDPGGTTAAGIGPCAPRV